MRRTGRRTLGEVAVAMAMAIGLASGCGGTSSESADEVATPSGQAAATTVATPPTAVTSTATPLAQSAEVVTNDGARLRISLAVGGVTVDDTADLCADVLGAGATQVPVTLTVLNLADRATPFPPLRLETTGADGARQQTLVREGDGECSAFPRVAQLGSGETAVFRGSTPAGAGRIEVRISETDFVLAALRP